MLDLHERYEEVINDPCALKVSFEWQDAASTLSDHEYVAAWEDKLNNELTQTFSDVLAAKPADPVALMGSLLLKRRGKAAEAQPAGSRANHAAVHTMTADGGQHELERKRLTLLLSEAPPITIVHRLMEQMQHPSISNEAVLTLSRLLPPDVAAMGTMHKHSPISSSW